MNDCPFCVLDDQYIIARNKLAVAHYFPHLLKPGHFVVSGQTHVKSFSDLPLSEITEIFALGQEVAQVISNIIEDVEKFYVLSIGDQGSHFHLHFLPKLSSDEMLGSYIFGDGGWKGKVAVSSTDSGRDALFETIQNSLLNE